MILKTSLSWLASIKSKYIHCSLFAFKCLYATYFAWADLNLNLFSVNFLFFFFYVCAYYLPIVLHKCRYLSALISQSFLDIGSVSRILDSIMKLCLQFCWNIENQESNPNTSELENIAEVQYLFHCYTHTKAKWSLMI